MKNCTYQIKILKDGKEEIIELPNEQALDTFLKENDTGKNWVKGVLSPDLTFSIDLQQQTLAKIDEINNIAKTRTVHKKKIVEGSEEIVDEDIEYYLEKTVGVLDAITRLPYPGRDNSSVLSPEFNEPKYHEDQIQKFLANGWAKDQTEAEEMYKKEKASWEVYRLAGEEIHDIFHSIITGEPEKAKTYISDEIATKIRKQVVDFINSIYSRYGKNTKILSELSILSKELEPDIKTIIKGDKDIDAISGRIDMLVIDEKGKAHLYDFKVSRKEPGIWNETNNQNISNDYWSSAKKNGITYQMAFYNAILRQYGIAVSDINLVPIKIDVKYGDEHKLNALDITGANVNKLITTIPGTLAGKFLENAMAYIPSTPGFKALVNVNKDYQTLMPTQSVDSQVRHFIADINYYKNKSNFIKYIQPEDKEHYGKFRFKFFERDLKNGKWIYCTDEKDLDAKLGNYVDKLNDKNSIELVQLGHDIKEAINGEINWNDIGANFTLGQAEFLSHQFEYYIKHKWFFHQDDDANAAGIFVFSKNGRSEIVMLTEKPINEVIKLQKGMSILGDFYDDSHWDKTKWMSASNGNLKILQALCYVANNEKYFLQRPISEIRTINPWHKMEVSTINSIAIDNFRRLALERKSNIKLNGRCFQDDITALIDMADERFRTLNLNTSFCIKDDALNEAYTKEWILNKIRGLRGIAKNLNDSNSYDANDPSWQTLTYLFKAYMKLLGYMTFNENDPGTWFHNGWQITGLMLSSGQNSPSSNMRMLYQLISNYSTDVRQQTLKTIAPVQAAFAEFYKEKGQNKLIGGEFKYFEEWFEKDENGKISKSFTLVDPYDPAISLSKKSREALSMFLDTIAYLKYPDKPAEEIERYRQTEEYRRVPILERRFGRRLTKNPFAAMKMWFKKNKALYEDVFGGEDGERQNWFNDDLDQERLYNHFATYDIESNRERAINELGVDGLETDLERVLVNAVSAYTRAEISRKYLPAINGFKLSMKYAIDHQHANLEKTYEAMLKSVKRKMYSESIMEDQNLRNMYACVSGIRSAFSGMTLGLSSKAFARELLQGFWTGISRAGVQQLQGVTSDTYLKAFITVAQDAWQNKDLTSKLPQLNGLYGMANYSLNDIADQQRLNWYGIRNFGTDTLYITSSAPDFQHRMTILIAKMMGDGCYEASMQLDKNGRLYYDFTKDKRFEIYRKGDTTNPNYLYQKALYLENIRQFNEEGGKPDGTLYREGDALPRAYTNKQILEIKNHADLLYGHYDQESKALINDTFLGSFFMQFRTWAVAGIERWFLSPGIYNGEEPKVQKTADGEELWYYYPDNDIQDNLSKIIVRKSDIPEDIMKAGLAMPYVQFEGNPMEGILFSWMRFTKAIWHRDQTELNELWKNPLYRKNLLMGLWDMFIMSMFVLLVRMLFELFTEEDLSKNITSQNWITQWTYGVLTGSTQDGQIHQILQSMFTDLNPPLIGQIRNFADSCWGVITGDDNIVYAMTRNFGAVREFQGLAKQLSE